MIVSIKCCKCFAIQEIEIPLLKDGSIFRVDCGYGCGKILDFIEPCKCEDCKKLYNQVMRK